MLFKEVQQNYSVFILEKESMTITEGKVVGKTFPKFNGNYSLTNPNQRSVVDISIDVKGKTAVYEIPEDVSVAFSNGLVLATDKSLLGPEIEKEKNQIDSLLNNIDGLKERSEKASLLLSEVNPHFREKKELEDRISKMEEVVSTMQNTVTDMSDSITKFIKEFKS